MDDFDRRILPDNVFKAFLKNASLENPEFLESLDGRVLSEVSGRIDERRANSRFELESVFAFPGERRLMRGVLRYLERKFSWLFALDDRFMRFQAYQLFLCSGLYGEPLSDGWNKAMFAYLRMSGGFVNLMKEGTKFKVPFDDLFGEQDLIVDNERFAIRDPKRIENVTDEYDRALNSGDKQWIEKAQEAYRELAPAMKNPVSRSKRSYGLLNKTDKGTILDDPFHPALQQVVEDEPFQQLMGDLTETTRAFLRAVMRLRRAIPSEERFHDVFLLLPEDFQQKMELVLDLSDVLSPCFMLDPKVEGVKGLQIATSSALFKDPKLLREEIQAMVSSFGVHLSQDDVDIQSSPELSS